MLMALDLDGDVDSGWQIELAQFVNGLGGRLNDIQQSLVRADLKLIHRLLVDVRGAIDGELLDPGRQRNRPGYLRAGALGRLDDLGGRSIQNAIIKSLEADAYALAGGS